MSPLTVIAILIPSILSFLTSAFYAYLGYKRMKEPPKDEVWETTTRLLSGTGNQIYSDDFAELYRELKFIKETGANFPSHYPVKRAMQEMQSEGQGSEQGSAPQ